MVVFWGGEVVYVYVGCSIVRLVGMFVDGCEGWGYDEKVYVWWVECVVEIVGIDCFGCYDLLEGFDGYFREDVVVENYGVVDNIFDGREFEGLCDFGF